MRKDGGHDSHDEESHDMDSNDDGSNDNVSDRDGMSRVLNTSYRTMATPVQASWKTEQLNSSDSNSDSDDSSETPNIMLLRGILNSPATSHVKHTGHNRITRHEPNTPATTETLVPDHSKASMTPPLDTGDADGFVPVLNRKRNKTPH